MLAIANTILRERVHARVDSSGAVGHDRSRVGLSVDLKAFVFACVDSVEQMEILVLLHGQRGPQSTHEVASRLGLTPGAARHHLETLTARGLLHIDVGTEARFSFAPRNERLRSYAVQLVAAYEQSRMDVLRAITQNAKGSLKSFADAFKLRGRE